MSGLKTIGGSVAMKAMIVPRGMDPSYYTFLRITAEANGQQLLVDRRLRERREAQQTGVERRVSDRRGPLPQTWTEDGFLLIERED
jgi:uncharacterized glyoxalase superfamily metalloenzyme YdcJ